MTWPPHRPFQPAAGPCAESAGGPPMALVAIQLVSLFQSMAETCSSSAGPSPLACLLGPLPAVHTHTQAVLLPFLSFTQQYKHPPASSLGVICSLAPSESANCRLPLMSSFLPIPFSFSRAQVFTLSPFDSALASRLPCC